MIIYQWNKPHCYFFHYYSKKAIHNLAPGDFRTVRQSLFYYGCDVTNVQRLDALEREAAAKEGGTFVVGGKLGF